MAAWYGLQVGAYQAYSRAIFGTLIPRGKER
jgi:MFS-type transporter involved in bile tolerance (Atg22 family)